MPKLSRISPMAGAKRLFGIEAAVQFGKGLAKIFVVGVAGGVPCGTSVTGWRGSPQMDLARCCRPSCREPAAAAGMLCTHLAITLGDYLYRGSAGASATGCRRRR